MVGGIEAAVIDPATTEDEWTAAPAVILLAAGAAALAFTLLANAGDPFGAGIAVAQGVVAGVVLTKTGRRWTRREALFVSALLGVVAVGMVAVIGDRALPLLLVSTLIAAAVDFHVVSGRVARDESGLPRDPYGIAVALGPPFLGGAILVNHHDLAGRGLVALILAPALYCAPAISLFVDASAEHARRRHKFGRAKEAKEAGADLHSRVGPATRVIRRAAALAKKSGVGGEACKQLDAAAGACAAAEREVMRQFGLDDEELIRMGFLTGEGKSLAPRFRTGMVLFGDTAHTPAWLPPALQRVWQRFGHAVDLARDGLHTSRIERVALFETLWLRAALLLAVPGLAVASFAPQLPQHYDRINGRSFAWVVVAMWCTALAFAAPVVVSRALDPTAHGFRRLLLTIEVPMSVVCLLAYPSWPMAVVVSGPWNWSQRPEWRARALAASAALIIVPFAVGVLLTDGWTWTSAAAELALALLVVAIMSSSYGLMLPLVLRAAIVIPIRIAVRRRIVEYRVRRAGSAHARRALRDAEAVLRPLLSESPQEEKLQRALREISRANGQLRFRPLDALRRSWTLEGTLSSVLFKHVPAEGTEEEAPLHAFRPLVQPPSLGTCVLPRRTEHALKDVLKHALTEASNYGEGLVSLTARLAAPEVVEIVLNNEIAAEAHAGTAQGRDLIPAAVRRLPDGVLLARGRRPAEFPLMGEMYEVRFAFQIDEPRFLRRLAPSEAANG